MEIKTKIYNMIEAYNINFKIVDDILDYIESMGYIPIDNDVFTIGFAILKIDSKIKNTCAITLIPDELHFAFVELCLAEILSSFKATGKLNLAFNLGENIKTVNIGDTSVTFDLSSADISLQNLIDLLFEKGEVEILCYRKLRW